MFVRMKFGPYIGQVREVKFLAGTELIAAGRAERVDPGAPALEVVAPPPAAPPAKLQVVAKKKKH